MSAQPTITQQGRQNPMKPHLSQSQSEYTLTNSTQPFYRSSLFSCCTLHSTSKNNYLIQQDKIWPLKSFEKFRSFLSGVHWTVLLFCLYSLSEGLLHFVFLLQPLEILSHYMKVEAIPVKDMERLLSSWVWSSHMKPFDNFSKPSLISAVCKK